LIQVRNKYYPRSDLPKLCPNVQTLNYIFVFVAWNIVQLTPFIQSKNRFGLDLYARRQIPQLLLSALAVIPGETERSNYTTFCPDPTVYEGSLMRLGLMEEFQKILGRNLVISDDAVVISRKNYWEERKKHNDALKVSKCTRSNFDTVLDTNIKACTF